MKILPLYDHFFPIDGQSPDDWSAFKKCDLSLEIIQPDLSMTTATNWTDTVKKISSWITKIIIFPWGLYESLQFGMRWAIMRFVLPAQELKTSELEAFRIELSRALMATRNYVARDLILEKDGTRYSALLFGNHLTMGNRKWALYSGGNNTTLETTFLSDSLFPFLVAGYNVLVVNGPNVGKSEGWASCEKIADAQELGLKFLESAVKAKNIVLAGHSLGAAAIGLAALQHDFKPEINYLVLRMMTFSRLTDIVRKVVAIFLKNLFSDEWAKLIAHFVADVVKWSGSEMDSIKASQKFRENRIHEVILRGEMDDFMDGADLLQALENENQLEEKTGLVVPNAYHNTLPYELIREKIVNWDLILGIAPI